jgi:chemotaxis protein CheX
MDDKLMDPFIYATVNVLETMAFTAAEAGTPYVKKDRFARGDVSAILGLTGDMSGTLSVSFSDGSILSIVSAMLGERIDEMNDEISDAVGEITNMISGVARKRLGEIGVSLRAAIPTVIMGKNHTIARITDQPVVAVTFQTHKGDFTIELCFEG